MRNPYASQAIVRRLTPAEAELAILRAELARLRSKLMERERSLDELRRHLISFEGRYIRQVGKLYKQLDEWEKKVAALHPETGIDLDAAADAPETLAPEPPKIAARDPRSTLTLRAMFRELALRIHPDHALDADDEARRTQLMAQANDAFRRKDGRILRRMLRGFDVSGDFETTSIHDELRETRDVIAQTQKDIASVNADTASMASSQLAEVERSAIAAAQQGRDLLAEMAARVKGRIGLTMRQYDLDLSRIRRPDRGMKMEALLTAEKSTKARQRR